LIALIIASCDTSKMLTISNGLILSLFLKEPPISKG